MYILGLNAGHNSTACLLKDGKIIGCVQEERFARIKNYSGIPFKSIEYLLKEEKISLKDIDLIVFDDHYSILEKADFGKEFLEAFTKKPKTKKILSFLGYKYPNLFNLYLNYKKNKIKRDKPLKDSEKISRLAKQLNFPRKKILIMDHHLAHAFAPCFNLPKNKKTLIFTLDGEGSGLCATVNIFDGKNLKKISETQKEASLGYLYAITTIHLGMKPLQHEFKVMGLAPYAKEHNISKIYSKLRNLFNINHDLSFKSKFSMPLSDNFLEREMKYVRVDVLSGAVQKLVEDLTCEWIKNAIKKTGISDIALSGGVFMNVKANQKIMEIPEVKSLFIMPSCGDEANAFGACYYGYKKLCDEKSKKFFPIPFSHLYLGPLYDNAYIENMIKNQDLEKKYKITQPKNINKEIAKLLANGKIVARCSGKSEWGARALGNRSILANPKDQDTIRILNETIKDRDFWMPFTPSMLDSYEKKYFENPKNIQPFFMVITFNSKPLAQKHLPAAMHPYDFTLRPQIVKKEHNKDYYEIIAEFAKLTGSGDLLNTSFNLHGEPNVLTPEDALHTIDNSSLKYLACENYLFEKIQ